MICDEELALLRGIVDQPLDDLPRLVYADWLDEHGQSFRAELIRVQLRRRQLPENSPEANELAIRCHELRHIKPSLFYQIENFFGITAITYERGLPEVAIALARDFLSRAKLALECLPIRELTITGMNRLGCLVLTDCPGLSHVEQLALSDELDDSCAELLASCPYLRNLRGLYLENNQISDRGAFALSQSPYLQSLVSIDLTNNPVRGPGLAVLRQLPSLRHVTPAPILMALRGGRQRPTS